MKLRSQPKIIPAAYNFSGDHIEKLRKITYKRYQKFINSPLYESSYKLKYNLELKFINNITVNDILNIDTCKEITKHNPNINLEKITNDVKNRFYDIRLMNMLACISNLSTYIYNPYPSYNRNWNLRLFWGDLHKIASGVFGTVYNSKQDYINNTFVIKYSGKLKYGMIHETFISLVMNRFRSKIFNFMYGFGYFKCSKPIRIIHSRVSSFCNQREGGVFGVFEKLDSFLLSDYIGDHNINITSILDKYLQILLALNIALEVKYSHNDLHTVNILLRKVQSKIVYLPYNYKNKTIYLKTDYIATIVDYGNSFVSLNGISYGPFGLEKAGAYPDTPNYISDAYKLLMFMSYDLLAYRQDEFIVDQLEPIFKFFNKTDNFIETIRGSRGIYYSIPDSNYGYNHTLLIDHILNIYPETKNIIYDIPPPKANIISCSEKGCLQISNEGEYLQKIINPVEKTILNFLKETKNNNPSRKLIDSYKNDVFPVFTSGFADMRKIMIAIKLMVKNSIDPKLLISEFNNVHDVLEFGKIVLYTNSVINNFGNVVIKRDSLLNFYFAFDKSLKIKFKLIERINNDYLDLHKRLIVVMGIIENIIFENQISIKLILKTGSTPKLERIVESIRNLHGIVKNFINNINRKFSIF